MRPLNRRELLGALTISPALFAIAGCQSDDTEVAEPGDADPAGVAPDSSTPSTSTTESTMKVQYLEIVTTEMDALCTQYEKTHGVQFGEPEANLGGARTAKLDDGGMLGIRAPLRETEAPVVRPYLLVDDIEAAVKAAADAGAEVAMPATPIPTGGKFAIVIHGGIDCGFWEL